MPECSGPMMECRDHGIFGCEICLTDDFFSFLDARRKRIPQKMTAVIEPGQRYAMLKRFAEALRFCGASNTEIEAALLAANAARCTPPKGEDEVRKIARAVAKQAPLTFYVASSRDRLEDVAKVTAFLEERGLANAFAWPTHFSHACAEDVCGVRDRADLARQELDAVAECSLFIGIARMGKGAHVELGVALYAALHDARAKRVILVGADRTDSVFYEALGVEHVCDLPALFSLLESVGQDASIQGDSAKGLRVELERLRGIALRLLISCEERPDIQPRYAAWLEEMRLEVLRPL